MNKSQITVPAQMIPSKNKACDLSEKNALFFRMKNDLKSGNCVVFASQVCQHETKSSLRFMTLKEAPSKIPAFTVHPLADSVLLAPLLASVLFWGMLQSRNEKAFVDANKIRMKEAEEFWNGEMGRILPQSYYSRTRFSQIASRVLDICSGSKQTDVYVARSEATEIHKYFLAYLYLGDTMSNGELNKFFSTITGEHHQKGYDSFFGIPARTEYRGSDVGQFYTLAFTLHRSFVNVSPEAVRRAQAEDASAGKKRLGTITPEHLNDEANAHFDAFLSFCREIFSRLPDRFLSYYIRFMTFNISEQARGVSEMPESFTRTARSDEGEDYGPNPYRDRKKYCEKNGIPHTISSIGLFKHSISYQEPNYDKEMARAKLEKNRELLNFLKSLQR